MDDQEAERRFEVERAHTAAIIDNFLWELDREWRRIIKPIADWLADRL